MHGLRGAPRPGPHQVRAVLPPPWMAGQRASPRWMSVRLAVRPNKRARPNRQVHANKQCAHIGRCARSGADYAVRTAVLVSWIFLMADAARGASFAQENEQHGDI